MARAHSLGQITLEQHNCSYANDAETHNAPQSCFYFSNTTNEEFAYCFLEYNPDDNEKIYPFHTNRIIKASTGTCYQYHLKKDTSNEGPPVFHIYNETYKSTLTVPGPYLANDSSTFIYNGTKIPEKGNVEDCGSRCLWMYAFRQQGPKRKDKDVIYGCPITVSEVQNASQNYHRILDQVARDAAASIAMDTRSRGEHWEQYQLYRWGSDWEIGPLNMPQEVRALMARHAIRSIANMAQFNPTQQQTGTLSTLGYHLTIKWGNMIALTTVIVGIHASIVILMLYLARNVVVVDDSHLAIARLLQDLVGGLDRPEIATAIQKKCVLSKETGVAYSVDHTGAEKGSTLTIGEQVTKGKDLPWKRFPEGFYA